MSTKPTALVIGAASGIGRAFAQALASRGGELFLVDASREGLDAARQALHSPSANVWVATADVADRRALERALSELLAADSGLDLLVHCAATLGPAAFATQAPEEFERVIAVDLLGTANAVRAALPWLRRGKGRAVLFASAAALHGWPGLAAYSAAGSGVAGFAEAIRAELAADGVGVTTVFPRFIDTPLLQHPDLPPILRRGRRTSPEVVVRRALRAAARGRPRVFVPRRVRLIALLQGLAPSFLDSRGSRAGIDRAPAVSAPEESPRTSDAREATG